MAYYDMDIYITSGHGYGRTLLSAFDKALQNAGIHNYNLIFISSVIPPNSKIKMRKFVMPKEEYGHKLYVVKAEIRSNEVDKFIGSALGWYQTEDGRGVFVEHTNLNQIKETVEANLCRDVENSLKDLCSVRKFHFDRKKMGIKTNVVKIYDKPASSLVLAVYQSNEWVSKTS